MSLHADTEKYAREAAVISPTQKPQWMTDCYENLTRSRKQCEDLWEQARKVKNLGEIKCLSPLAYKVIDNALGVAHTEHTNLLAKLQKALEAYEHEPDGTRITEGIIKDVKERATHLQQTQTLFRTVVVCPPEE